MLQLPSIEIAKGPLTCFYVFKRYIYTIPMRCRIDRPHYHN